MGKGSESQGCSQFSRYGFLFFVFISAVNMGLAQVERIEPPNWWVGFEDQKLQLLLYGDGIGQGSAKLDHSQVSLEAIHRADSPNYLFLDLIIQEGTPACQLEFELEQPGKAPRTFTYELREREHDSSVFTGFSAKDAIYLITPDRFANGVKDNDEEPAMREKAIDRKDDYARHGGDIRGVINHLDYISDMGFTAIWPSPLLENDMPEQSYHGYAITDFYRVDPRFGTLGDYRELADKAREKGIKLIMDQVANHCGLYHWWMQDLPFSDWINDQSAFENGKDVKTSNHRRTTHQDPYASRYDKDLMVDGWFVTAMPDLNQENTFLANYIIQNSIWWIETLGLGGIRQDTYPYPDKHFMASWAKRIMLEYPDFSIVGEEWSYNPLLVAYWQDGMPNKDGYRSYLKSTMDFPMQRTLVESLVEEEDWNSGLIRLYEALANDFHYATPEDLLLFADNHDMDRVFTQVNEDPVLARMALAFVLIAPRIPQVYYGTEILMENTAKPDSHGLIRSDFPGGWEGDSVNAFTGEGLTSEQKEMQQFLKKILQFRKEEKVLHGGRTKHFAPNDGVYVLFRFLGDSKVVLILNKNKKTVELDLSRFAEMDLEGKRMRNIISGEILDWTGSLLLKERDALILTNVK
ncbi:glycoside hydrolase family 13 protein [Lentiprolixibacter aurantiacus]|uniref:Glycoside hydrolase family 13 protein n=1 Tax=Lentiprolixibacter aurantiacus TaxID=2993939 RepID=A0AAE3MIH8_9FLAO|nr:glycoside hydrolase family 13 protein [Lentiprolixibacter aurantiacus]MCX2718166.1 glycoside hydrolase family 13 protein [Lentiprolixibacter aurantiacus]